MIARTLCTALAALVVAHASAAYADDPTPPMTDVERPAMSITIDYLADGTGHRVCARGARRTTTVPTALGSWQFTISGARSDGSQISYTASSVGATFPEVCPVVKKLGVPYGNYTARFTYLGVGGDTVGAIVGDGIWQPGSDNRVQGSQ